MILASLLHSTDNDTRAQSVSALNSAVVLLDYGVEILDAISNATDFEAAVPPLLALGGDARIVSTSATSSRFSSSPSSPPAASASWAPSSARCRSR